jgi:hypothetical protein
MNLLLLVTASLGLLLVLILLYRRLISLSKKGGEKIDISKDWIVQLIIRGTALVLLILVFFLFN